MCEENDKCKLTDDNTDSDEDTERIKLTPEQQASLHCATKKAHEFDHLVNGIQVPALSEATRRNIHEEFQVAESKRQQADALIGPLLPNIEAAFQQLTKNIDFSFAEHAAKAADQFIAQQETLLKKTASASALQKATFSTVYPLNLQHIKDFSFQEIEQVIMVDGIPLYGVPRSTIAEALIRADRASKRREILDQQCKTILDDCPDTMEQCTSDAVTSYVPYAVAAIKTQDNGHIAAAQALAASLIDATLRSHFGKDRLLYTPDRKGKKTTDAYYELHMGQLIAFAPTWQAYQQFFSTNGDKSPTTFNRHATAHTVSDEQFNRCNAVQGLMFACSLLQRLNEEANMSDVKD